MSFGPPTLIASDVDGTLIDDANKVSERTLKVLGAARDSGAEFVLATGRPPRWIAEITDQFDGNSPVRYAVCANGAIVYDVAHDHVMVSATMHPEALELLVERAYRQLPGCGIAAERVGRSAHDAATPPFVATSGYRHAWLNPDHVEVGDDEVYSEPAVKLLVRQPEMSSQEMAARMAPVVGSLAQITFSTDNGLIELSLPDTHKASGLEMLAALAHLDDSATVAFGDMPNDVEMLTWAHHGVAMGHGHPAAREAADEITVGNNEDGVARVLERWFG
ncbi:HAD family hydrolase [Gordonia sp. CPCC 205515]|uniref:HAD family hydrolase n=1 Tax=Gordonia sp. CPCC 205515 TaxID=3140791 RepID=UPI003AF3DBD8